MIGWCFGSVSGRMFGFWTDVATSGRRGNPSIPVITGGGYGLPERSVSWGIVSGAAASLTDATGPPIVTAGAAFAGEVIVVGAPVGGVVVGLGTFTCSHLPIAPWQIVVADARRRGSGSVMTATHQRRTCRWCDATRHGAVASAG